jgi:hypothetical protein
LLFLKFYKKINGMVKKLLKNLCLNVGLGGGIVLGFNIAYLTYF